ncbi:DUF916 domain-containing protein [Leuconostoc gelidum subsp. aenigmaticum]|jgi:hypothetical protein|uniref:DUF916 domain-containing protein n=1 Tax=Leuconostoc gelidum TaxID=1244 RepID=UPI0015760346|nr:DUF916 domain-containing protein [Leuconostoc gelidum]MBZ5979349.1 DUF916 domain-containing protein [Leuconostoc gelidum subsp. gelidum]MBZ6002234.1 DUF916 domain-containing protein [Leuconostoc gelidum subsp. gelidum]MBZ6003761.1 DUF916 domain-containing protein [Leuconostoc gelidum subsp. aenigmaticum]MBZ6010115.1 DUF916 domain-containing protein [Leuconostoc gelidum subsp. aenigmaticum]
MKIFKCIFWGIFLLCCSLTVQTVSADKTGTFSVSPILSDHQTKGIDTFYDIRWTPGKSDTIGVTISNKTDKEQSYEIAVNKARTNKNGIIDYSDGISESKSILYKFSDLLKLPMEVVVPAQSSKSVTGTINFPDNSYNGILMAGIHISEKNVINDKSMVSNKVAYNLPLIIRGNSDKRSKAEMALTELLVKQYSSKTYSLNIHLNNKKATFLKNSKFKSVITNSRGKQVTSKISYINVTPETTFEYPIELSKKYPAGKYNLKLVITHGKKDHWTFNKTFKINDDQAKSMNTLRRIGKTAWWIYGLICFGIIGITGLIILFVINRRKKKVDNY